MRLLVVLCVMLTLAACSNDKPAATTTPTSSPSPAVPETKGCREDMASLATMVHTMASADDAAYARLLDRATRTTNRAARTCSRTAADPLTSALAHLKRAKLAKHSCGRLITCDEAGAPQEISTAAALIQQAQALTS